MSANNDHLVTSDDKNHPANLIPTLCAKFWTLGWVTGTGGGCSIRDEYVQVFSALEFLSEARITVLAALSSASVLYEFKPQELTHHSDLVYIAPSGVQKELLKASDLYVLALSQQTDLKNRVYLRAPPGGRPSQCTPLFLAAFTKRGAGCCIHTHSHWAVLVTLILEARGPGADKMFEINNIEQVKAFPRGSQKSGVLDYHDTLRIPVIENTSHEEDLTEFLEQAMAQYPDTYAVLVRRHGVYVWGDNVHKAKTMCESLDYLFQLAVEMQQLGLPWLSNVPKTITASGR